MLELTDLDLIFIPGLIFDRQNHRLSFGTGYYDRLLSKPHRAYKIGLAYSAFIRDRLPVDPWDQPVDAICTEKEWIGIG